VFIDDLFKRVTIPHTPSGPNGIAYPADSVPCPACAKMHPQGACPLKIAGVEYCGLCGIAHYGIARSCPHVRSERMVGAMLETLKHSTEPEHLRLAAIKYLKGVKGHLVQNKKRRMERKAKEQSDPQTSHGSEHLRIAQDEHALTGQPSTVVHQTPTEF
jgi:chromodomain-helicase-DNA-binding protein 4